MVNGRLIQELDVRHVPSERRNPVLADIFNRLGLMERQGSGLSKIVEGYQFEENYSEDKKPAFFSDRTQFIVMMPNLNYNVPQDVSQDVPQDSLNSQIISMIKDNNKISTETMASVLGTSSKTIKRHIKSMPNIHYVGRGSNGHWEIKE